MGDMGDVFKAMRESNKARMQKNRDVAGIELMVLVEDGYDVRHLTDYHYRINDQLDIYPSRRRFHILQTNKRGNYGNDLVDFVNQYFKVGNGRTA